ncbi:MAG TPA: biotin--[acetyl-CoA-carboxylase] ligase [Gemmatimonadaceae bacterium]|nr:biotin--[acetyl-CoA-carboxylase] ligase [Gemmatimonadaceae bacterium]
MSDPVTYDGWSADALRAALELPRVEVRHTVSSTFDLAHALAASGAPAGTLVVADAQRAGRGRLGRPWTSLPGAGIWLTLVERPADAEAIEVLSIRLGLALAPVLDSAAPVPVQLKWPNDLYLPSGKLAGILVETRWRDAQLDWVAIGLGINVRAPSDQPRAAGLSTGCNRGELLVRLLPALRAAAAARGPLTTPELADYAARDVASGRRCREPARGEVRGIDCRGALVVRTADGDVACRTGSLILEDER